MRSTLNCVNTTGDIHRIIYL